MDQNQDFSSFKNEFYGYANVITALSKRGEDLLNSIYQKKDNFNKLNENQRFEFMKADADFAELQAISDKLEKAYVLYYNFIAENMQDILQTKPETKKVDDLPSPSADKVTYESME